MVENLTPRQLAKLQRREDEAGKDVLSPIDRDMVGASACQLRIPLDDPAKMAEYAVMVEGLGSRLHALCTRTDWGARSVMMEYRAEVRGCQRMIDEYRDGGWKPAYMVVDNSGP